MADHDVCEHCLNPDSRVVRSTLMPRGGAVALYVRLQHSGYFPAMCENHSGQCRVCYSEELPAAAKAAPRPLLGVA